MWGNLDCLNTVMDGGLAKSVPQLGGLCRTGLPVDGKICLSVDQSSLLVLVEETYICLSSADRETDLKDASPSGTQCLSVTGS